MYSLRMVGVIIDQRLIEDSEELGDLRLCRALLRDDADFDWIVLVPRRVGLRHLLDLPRTDRAVLMDEIAAAFEALRDGAKPERIDVEIAGGPTSQLHASIVGSRHDSPDLRHAAWDGVPRRPLPREELRSRGRRLRALLGLPRL